MDMVVDMATVMVTVMDTDRSYQQHHTTAILHTEVAMETDTEVAMVMEDTEIKAMDILTDLDMVDMDMVDMDMTATVMEGLRSE